MGPGHAASGRPPSDQSDARRRWRLVKNMSFAMRGFMGSLNPTVDMRNNRVPGRPAGAEGTRTLPRTFGDRTALLRRPLASQVEDTAHKD